MSPPVLDYPRKHDHFTLTTDASDVGLGAVLSTPRNTVIEYASRALTPAEKKTSQLVSWLAGLLAFVISSVMAYYS